MSIQDIIDAAAAQNQLHDRINNFLDALDLDITNRLDTAQAGFDASQAAYGALASDLAAVADDRIVFTADWRPTQPETPGSGGSYQNLQALLDDTLDGSTVNIELDASETYDITSHYDFGVRIINFIGSGGPTEANRPVLNFPVEETATQTRHTGSFTTRFSTLTFKELNIELNAALNGKPRDGRGVIRRASGGVGTVNLGFNTYVKITGADAAAFIDTFSGIHQITGYLLKLDGDVALTQTGGNGIFLIATRGTTLVNGAALQVGGTANINIFGS